MPDCVSPYDELVTNQILQAVDQVYSARREDAAAVGRQPTDERDDVEVDKLREAVMAALATDRSRRERYRVAPSEDRVVTAAEAGARLGLSRFTMLRMRQQPSAGGLPFVQLSKGRIGYRLSDIDSYLLARRVGRLPDEVVDPPQRRQTTPRKSIQRRPAEGLPVHRSPLRDDEVSP